MNTRTSLSAFALAALAGLAQAQTCTTVTKLTSGIDAAADDNFAAAISMSFGGLNNAPLLAVGMPNEDAPVSGNDAGGFTVYQKPFGAWTVMYDSWNTTGQGGEQLGASISLSDPYLIAGAPGYSNTGRARIYRRPSNGSGYTGPVDVVPSLSGAGSDFGRAVAVSSFEGGWAAVGAPLHDFHGLVDSGAVFFYNFDAQNYAWPQTTQVWGADFAGDSLDHRGASVAMSQSSGYAAVGSPNHEVSGNPADHGTVYVFKRVNGVVNMQPTRITPPSPELNEHFGASVAIEGDIMAVGSPDEDLALLEGGSVMAASNCGAMYIYQRDPALFNTWNFVAKFRAPTPTTNGHFASSIATDGTQIVVGESTTKNAYVFSNDGGSWHYQATFSDTDSAANGSFANAVAVKNNEVAIADMLDENNSVNNAGAVYVANLDPAENNGDLCSNPLSIPAGDYTGCTANATPTPSSGNITSCGTSNDSNDVYFEFAPTCDGNAIFDTFGSSYDTVLSVHSSCPNALGTATTITCNDDASFAAPHNRDSLVTFNFTGGQTYLIRVSGYNGASGQFVLRHLYTYSVQNDTCATASSVGSSYGTWQVNTCSATSDPLSTTCAGAIYNDVWYRWNATNTGPVNVNTCGSTFDTVLQVFQGTQQSCPTQANQAIACNDDSFDTCSAGESTVRSDLTFTATAGQSYLIRLGGYWTTDFGPAQLTIGAGSYCNDIDFNNDGLFPDTQDIDDLLTVFSGGACSTNNCDPVDFNTDTLFPDTLDIDAFISVFSGGPCLR